MAVTFETANISSSAFYEALTKTLVELPDGSWAFQFSEGVGVAFLKHYLSTDQTIEAAAYEDVLTLSDMASAGVYDVDVFMPVIVDSTDLLRVSFGGTATFTNFALFYEIFSASALTASGLHDAKTDEISFADGDVLLHLYGTVKVNAGGTFIITAKKITDVATDSTISKNSKATAIRLE